MRYVLFGFLVLVTLAGASRAYAQCDCVYGGESEADEIKRSDAAFIGEVVEVRELKGAKDSEHKEFSVTFNVKQSLKGAASKSITLRNTNSPRSDFREGEIYFVIASIHKNHLFAWTGCCTRTRRIPHQTEITSVGAYRQANEHRLLSEYVQFLSIPNVASDTTNIRKNAHYILAEMQKRGLKPQLLEAADKKVPPVVYGEYMTPGAAKTVIFYAHYDGQPTDASQWTGSKPWEPVLRTASLEKGGKIIPFPKAGEKIDPEWRIYARSASDDKAGVFAILTAFDALIAKGIKPTVNIKFFFEGEEEAGSPNLKEILTKHTELLKADAFIVCDGPVHQSGRKQVVFGVRGDVNVDLTVYGAKRPLHSGHYGNWSPNPALLLAKLLSSMKDDKGNIIVKVWADDVEPLGEAEMKAIGDAPQYDEQLKRELGIAYTEGGGKSLLERINQPSLNINGIKSGDVGEQARNVIPTTATTVLDLRLVKGNDHIRQVAKLRKHIESQGYYVTTSDPTDEERQKYPLIAKFIHIPGSYNAQRTRMDLPVSLAVVEAVKTTVPDKIVQMPSLGGSLPLSIISETLGVPTITVPIANHDNNQHAENENIRVQNLWDGIETFASLMTMRF